MPSVLVVGTNTYVSRADADAYAGDSLALSGWLLLPASTRDAALLTAFKLLERQVWQGIPTAGAGTTPHFPATGVTDCYGNAVDENTVPQQIEDAQIELAWLLTQDAELEGSTSTGGSVKKAQAGSASVEFFNRDGSPDYAVTRFPPNVHELVKCFLSSSLLASGAEVVGADGESIFDPCDNYDRNDPF